MLLATLLLCVNLSLGNGAPWNVRKRGPLYDQVDEEEDSFGAKILHELNIEPEKTLRKEQEEMNIDAVKEMFDLESGLPTDRLTEKYQTSDYMLGLYNRLADNRTGSLISWQTSRKGPSGLTEQIRSFSCKGKHCQ